MWASLTDVREALSSPESAAGTAASLPDGLLQAQVEEAEGLVNLYLSEYEVPLDDSGLAPQPVRGWVRNIAAYLAHLVWMRGKDVPMDEPNRLRYTDTLRFLEKVQNGEFLLTFSRVEGGASGDGGVYNVYEGRLLTKGVELRTEFAERPRRH